MSPRFSTLSSDIALQVPGVPGGPSPITALGSLLVLIVVLLVLGYAGLWLWRRVADSVRYDEQTRN